MTLFFCLILFSSINVLENTFTEYMSSQNILLDSWTHLKGQDQDRISCDAHCRCAISNETGHCWTSCGAGTLKSCSSLISLRHFTAEPLPSFTVIKTSPCLWAERQVKAALLSLRNVWPIFLRRCLITTNVAGQETVRTEIMKGYEKSVCSKYLHMVWCLESAMHSTRSEIY